MWLTGSPYRSEPGIVTAAGIARRAGIPLLGTCGGLQLAVIEFATEVAGLAEEEVLVPLSCSVGGDECVVLAPRGYLFERALGAERTRERYHCSNGLNPATVQVLTDHGLRFTGFDDEGVARRGTPWHSVAATSIEEVGTRARARLGTTTDPERGTKAPRLGDFQLPIFMVGNTRVGPVTSSV